MNHTIQVTLCALPLVLGGAAFGQSTTTSVVPAVPQAQGAGQPSADQIRAQIQQTNEQLAKIRANIAQVQEATPRVASMSAGINPPGSGGAGTSTTSTAPRGAPVVLTTTGEALPGHKAVPHTPSGDDVRRLQQELNRALSQRRAESVADGGMITATSASALRAEVVFPYVENSIYEVFAAPDRMTAIQLQPGEVISTDNGKPKAADTVQWVADTVSAGEGSDRRTIVMVKPIMTGIETNMLIPTNRHVYSILLRAESRAYMPLVAFSYAAEEARINVGVAQQAAARDATHEAVNVAPENMNFGYHMKGPKEVWTPLRVFDDGSKTYLQMPPEMKSWESPALFVMEEKNAPELVNYRVKGDYYIVDRLFHLAQLRIGTKKFVTIYRDVRTGS